MNYCPKCHKEYASDAAQFCNTCGSALVYYADNNETGKQMHCPSCGNTVLSDQQYCPRCGINLKLDNKDGTTDNKGNNNRTTLMIIIIVAVIAVIGAIGIRLYNTYFKKDTETTRSAGMSQTANTDGNQTSSSVGANNDNDTKADTTSSSAKSLPVITSAITLNGVELGSSNVSSDRSFEAYKAIDGDGETCWCVNTNEKGGAGAQLRISLESASPISGVKLVNGNQFRPNEDLYSLNGQIKDFTLKFSNGKELSFTAEYNSGDPYYFQEISFSEPIETEYIVLTVQSAYIGTKFGTNVCITEFSVY